MASGGRQKGPSLPLTPPLSMKGGRSQSSSGAGMRTVFGHRDGRPRWPLGDETAAATAGPHRLSSVPLHAPPTRGATPPSATRDACACQRAGAQPIQHPHPTAVAPCPCPPHVPGRAEATTSLLFQNVFPRVAPTLSGCGHKPAGADHQRHARARPLGGGCPPPAAAAMAGLV